MHIPHFVYPFFFTSWWIFNLFPVWGFYEQYCYDVQLFVDIHFPSSGRLLGAELVDHTYGKFMFNLLRNWQFIFLWRLMVFEHLFMFLLAICISVIKYLLKTYPFVSWVICFTELKNSLRILDKNPLSGKWFANIFSQTIAHLFIFLIVLKKFLILIKFSFINSFMDCTLWCHILKTFAKPKVIKKFF